MSGSIISHISGVKDGIIKIFMTCPPSCVFTRYLDRYVENLLQNLPPE